MLLFIYTFSYNKINRTKKKKKVWLHHDQGDVECFTLYNFTNATRAGRNCINLFISASLSNLLLLFLHMLPFLLVTYNTLPVRVCSVDINLEPHPELSLKLSVHPSTIHPSSLHLFLPQKLPGQGEEHTLVKSPAKWDMKSRKNLYGSRSEFHMGGRTETQTLTDEADGILNVIYLTTECSARAVHGECDSLRRTNINSLRTRWVIELGMKTQTVGTHDRGIRRKK